jgi:hypothetical protein
VVCTSIKIVLSCSSIVLECSSVRPQVSIFSSESLSLAPPATGPFFPLASHFGSRATPRLRFHSFTGTMIEKE